MNFAALSFQNLQFLSFVKTLNLLSAVGINEEGYREILGFMVGDSESEESWSEFFSWFKQRGLDGVDLVVSDHHNGLVRAIRQYFQGRPGSGVRLILCVISSKKLRKPYKKKSMPK